MIRIPEAFYLTSESRNKIKLKPGDRIRYSRQGNRFNIRRPQGEQAIFLCARMPDSIVRSPLWPATIHPVDHQVKELAKVHCPDLAVNYAGEDRDFIYWLIEDKPERTR